MTASYPGSVKSFTAKIDGINYIYASHVNDIQEEVSAVETSLVSGSFPNGGKFQGNVEVTGNLMVSGTSTFVGDPLSMINASGTTTVFGWSSFTIREIWYAKFGKLVFMNVNIQGTSNNVSGTFSLPYPIVSAGARVDKMVRVQDNGTFQAGRMVGLLGSNEIVLMNTVPGVPFTASGTKAVFDSFFYFTN